MADLIIKPSSGNSLVLQDEGGDAALTVGTTGNTTLAGTLGVTGNATLSGTANNLGTATAGTLGSNVVFPNEMIFDYKCQMGGTGGYTLNQSISAVGLSGLTGTLKYASEKHVIKIQGIRGAGKYGTGGTDQRNHAVGIYNVSASSLTHSNGNPSAEAQMTDFNTTSGLGSKYKYLYYEDVPFHSDTGSHGTNYAYFWFCTTSVLTVTGTAGSTTYVYYPIFSNPSPADTYIGKAQSTSGAQRVSFELMRYVS